MLTTHSATFVALSLAALLLASASTTHILWTYPPLPYGPGAAWRLGLVTLLAVGVVIMLADVLMLGAMWVHP